MSESQAREQRSDGATLERNPDELLAAAKPLPADEDVLIADLTEDEARRFLAAILDA